MLILYLLLYLRLRKCRAFWTLVERFWEFLMLSNMFHQTLWGHGLHWISKESCISSPQGKKSTYAQEHKILSIISRLGRGNVPSRSPALEKYFPVHGLSAQAGPWGHHFCFFMAPSQDDSNRAQQEGLDPLTWLLSLFCFSSPQTETEIYLQNIRVYWPICSLMAVL